MIPKHIARKPANDNYRALAIYIADASVGGEKGEKTLMSWHQGCLSDNYHSAMIEAEATQEMNTRTKKEKTYHLMVSFNPEDESKLTPEIFKEIEQELAKALGFSGHQRHCGVHKNTDNLHMHVAYNMIHSETFNIKTPYYDWPKLHKICRELEQKYGFKIDKGIGDSDKKTTKSNAKAEAIEAQTGQQSFYNYVVTRKELLLEIVRKAENWKQIHEGFLKLGLEIKPRNNGLVFIDRYGKHPVKASNIDRALSKPQMEKVFGSFIGATKEQLQIESDEKYAVIPLHNNERKDELFAQFQAEMEQRKTALAEGKSKEKESYDFCKNKWANEKKAIEKFPMLPADRQRVLDQIKAREEIEIAENRMALAEQMKAVRETIPYTSWTKFLQHKAALGDEDALTVLRSKKMHPELSKTNSAEKITSDLQATIDSKIKQTEILKMKGINKKHQKALLSVIKMQELISKEFGGEKNQMKYEIDTKGIIIFTLKSGGTIRDSGTEIHFSFHDQMAKELAEKFAKLKWGKRASKEQHVIKSAQVQKKQGLSL